MIQRAITMAILCLAIGAPCRGSNLDAQLFPLTGEIRLRNPSATAVPFVYYSIASSSGALNNSSPAWKSISDNYDVSGNGFIDPIKEWMKISSLMTQLTEGVFTGAGGNLAAFRSVSLGQIWTSAPSTDLVFSVIDPDSQPVTITVQTALAGDYFVDHTVNLQDYTVWRQNFGSTSSLDADGNLNGIVDAADYAIWRDNFGNSIPPGAGSLMPGGGNGSYFQLGTTVPEPTSAVLFLLAAGTMFTARARAPRAARRAVIRCSVRQ